MAHSTAILFLVLTLGSMVLQARQPPFTYNNTHFPYDITGPAPPSLYRPGQIVDRCIQKNSYAISFDDGPGQLTDELLDHLDEQQLKVTLFMNGNSWSCIYAPESQRLLRRAYASQHQIAAHPWSHQDLESLSDKDIRQEMHRIEQAFREILGVVPRYMRPPFGEHGERVRRVLEEMGYVIVLWDVDHLGSQQQGQEDDEGAEVDGKERPMTGHHHRRYHSHHSISSSPSSSKWAEAVRGVPSTTLDRDDMLLGGIYQEATPEWGIEYVQSLGYKIMTVGQCLGEEDPRLWYKEVGPPADLETIPRSCR
ncbi:Carbohydrate esterase 4 protein [Mortierella claussenii]|nr:Carbohydrate esterase 4 protein [Mortierella claussenii]